MFFMINPKKRQVAKEFEDPEEVQTRKEYIQELGRQKPKAIVPVIPLIEENEWRTDQTEYGLVIKKAKTDGPILQKNALPVPEILSEKQKYKVDVELRPDESLVDYEKMPIEDFGAALLRGMGWKEGKPVGKNQKGVVSYAEVKPRPNLLGLGAEPAPEIESKGRKPLLPGDIVETPKNAVTIEKEDIPLHDYKLGSKVIVVDGSKKGMRGKITDVTRKPDGIAIKIKISDEKTISVWDDQIEFDEQSWLRPHIRVV
jgi:hypothetical protein